MHIIQFAYIAPMLGTLVGCAVRIMITTARTQDATERGVQQTERVLRSLNRIEDHLKELRKK